jgi:glutamate dehydrogenase (NADP+)
LATLDDTLNWIEAQAEGQTEYLQSVESVCEEVVPVYNANELYKSNNVLPRLLVPDQILQFKVEWEDDTGECRVNRGWRVQHSQLLGPYKGGTRFVPSLNESVLKFLAFEQSFKNALSGMSLGAGKGGADFNPKQASSNEIRRFCNAYIEQLAPHIGENTDVPAGDIGVSSRELGWMFGRHLRLNSHYSGMLSGKPTETAGSDLRNEATGFGIVYMLEEVASHQQKALQDMRIAISGAGNVALHAALKSIENEATVLCLSNSRGTYFDEQGLQAKDINFLLNEASESDNALLDLAGHSRGQFSSELLPWDLEHDVAMPCATQNEIDKSAAQSICTNGAYIVIEGANMPCTNAAVKVINDAGLCYVPGKAANAGGVVLSGFEMQQNASFEYRSYEQLNKQLKQVMQSIHTQCIDESKRAQESRVNYSRAATVAGFRRLADALVASGY